MTDIKIINKNTDLSKLPKPFDWDLVVNGKPYYAVRIDGYVHTIGGKWGDNDIWAYPRDEKPTYRNLIEFNSDNPVCWGITYAPYNYSRCKWDECEIFETSNLSITRNGLKFCDVRGGIKFELAKAPGNYAKINETIKEIYEQKKQMILGKARAIEQLEQKIQDVKELRDATPREGNGVFQRALLSVRENAYMDALKIVKGDDKSGNNSKSD